MPPTFRLVRGRRVERWGVGAEQHAGGPRGQGRQNATTSLAEFQLSTTCNPVWISRRGSSVAKIVAGKDRSGRAPQPGSAPEVALCGRFAGQRKANP